MIGVFYGSFILGSLFTIFVFAILYNYDFKVGEDMVLKVIDKKKTCPECGQRTMELKEEYK